MAANFLLGWWIILIVVVILVLIFLRYRHIKHRFFLILLVLLIILMYFSFDFAFSGTNSNFNSVSGIFHAGKIYFSWLGHAFHNVKTIAGNAVHMNWTTGNSTFNVSK